jgi:hypothetical protein
VPGCSIGPRHRRKEAGEGAGAGDRASITRSLGRCPVVWTGRDRLARLADTGRESASITSPRNRPRAVSAVCRTPPSARARPGRADRCAPMIGNLFHAVARRGLRRVTCGSSARAGGRRILSAVLRWTGAVPAALVVAASHCGCAAGAHPEHQVRVLPSGWLHVDPVDVGEPPQTRLAQQHATQRLLCSVTPCMHEPSGCTDPVRPRALTARRHRRAPHGVWYPVEEGPFER